MNTGSEVLGIVIAILVGFVVLFFILRELNCWYWKINEIVAIMKEMSGKLDGLSTAPGAAQAGIVLREQISCRHCGKKTDMAGKFCGSCGGEIA